MAKFFAGGAAEVHKGFFTSEVDINWGSTPRYFATSSEAQLYCNRLMAENFSNFAVVVETDDDFNPTDWWELSWTKQGNTYRMMPSCNDDNVVSYSLVKSARSLDVNRSK